jgi:hypothetical protein
VSEHEDTAWFERLYAAAEAGDAEVPWDRGGPNPFLERWVRERELDGAGRRALVIGTALGDDAELLAARGFAVTAFDVAPTAIEGARRRFPGSAVDYRVADLLALPAEWRGAFDLVAECITVQSLPPSLRSALIDAIASTVAPGGTLIVVSGIHDDGPRDGPPWPLTRAELDRFEATLRPVEVGVARIGSASRWRGEYTRWPGELRRRTSTALGGEVGCRPQRLLRTRAVD